MRATLLGIILALPMPWLCASQNRNADPPPFKLSDFKLKQDGSGTAILETKAKTTGGYELCIRLLDTNGKKLHQTTLKDFMSDDAYENATDAWRLNGSMVVFKSKEIADFIKTSNSKAIKAVAQIMAGEEAVTNATKEVTIGASK